MKKNNIIFSKFKEKKSNFLLKNYSKQIISHKKSQIAIFILLSIFVLSLMVFLISSDFSNRTQTITQPTENVLINQNSDTLQLIQDSLDYCLQLETRKALMLAGARGGFIYDNGGEYISSSSTPSAYSDILVSNIGLNWASLFYQTLLTSQREVYSPFPPEQIRRKSISEDFSASIKEDFEKFILEGVISCMRLEEFENRGFLIFYEQFSGAISQVDPANNVVYVPNLIGEIGNKVQVSLNDRLLVGEITNFTLIGAEVEFSPLDFSFFSSIVDISSLDVINLNNSLRVGVEFKEESVISEVFFPVRIQSNSNDISITSSNAEVKVRFKKLLELSQILLSAKYNNRSLELSDISSVQEILKDNTYAQREGLSDLQFYETIVEESEVYKKAIYSFIDEKSFVYGSPYLFNFGYQNYAPLINLSSTIGGVTLPNVQRENNIAIITGRNIEGRINLKNFTSDFEFLDNFRSYFIEQEIQTSDFKFSVDKDGLVSFTPFLETIYSFDIQVTDGELTRTQNFLFIGGFPDNSNNEEARSCISFTQAESTFDMPILNDFRDLFSYTNDFGKEIVYGYTLTGEEINVKVSQGCFGPFLGDSAFTLKYSINGGSFSRFPIGRADNIDITVSSRVDVRFDVQDQNDISLLSEPLTVSFYPADCLGPGDIADFSALSCCNTGIIFNDIASNSPQERNNLLSGVTAINNVEVNACLERDSDFGFNLAQKILWDEINEDITSVFSAQIRSTCKGVNANPFSSDNVDYIKAIGPSKYNSRTTGATFISDGFSSYEKDFSFSLSEGAGVCEFCNLVNASNFIRDENGLVFAIGPKDKTTPEISPLKAPDDLDMFIRCDDDVFATLNGGISWTKSPLSNLLNISTGRFHTSYGFCQIDSNQCAGRIGSPMSKSQRDTQSTCTNWAFLGDIEPQQIGATWICGSSVKVGCDFEYDDDGNCISSTSRYQERRCTGVVGEACPIITRSYEKCECPDDD